MASTEIYVVSTNVTCNRTLICSDGESCTAKISYAIANKLVTGNITLFSTNRGHFLELRKSTGDVLLVKNTKSISLGQVDLAKLDCSKQDKDSKLLPIEMLNTDFSIEEVESSECKKIIGTDINGNDLFVKRAKYGILNFENIIFESSFNYVRCI